MENKRRISLCKNISKLFEKIIVNRLNKHLNFTETQVGVRPRKSTLNSLVALNQSSNREREGKETYVAFIDIGKA